MLQNLKNPPLQKSVPMKIRMLLLEDNPGDADLVREMFSEIVTINLDLQHVDRLNTALTRLSEDTFDIVLIVLS